jgi:hypothetical protein
VYKRPALLLGSAAFTLDSTSQARSTKCGVERRKVKTPQRPAEV